MEAGVHLPGQSGGVERVGRTVRRPIGPWTPAVHEYLAYLADAGLRGIPTVEGIEGDREVLSYVPGRGVPVDAEVVLPNVLTEAVTWLRDFHDIAEGFRPSEPLVWRSGPGELAVDEIVCHNDPGTYNWIIEGGHFAAMIDWDMAAPGRRIDDVAFMAWTAIPFDRPADDGDVLRRLDLLVDAYGEYGPSTVLAAIADRMESACTRITTGADRGDPALRTLVERGVPEHTHSRLAAFNERRYRWESRL